VEIITALAILLGIIVLVVRLFSSRPQPLTQPRFVRTLDVTSPGRALHARFVAVGNMTGKTADEIIAGVGPPRSRSSIAHGRMLLQWQATGYHMAILFDASGRFAKITHEYAHL